MSPDFMEYRNLDERGLIASFLAMFDNYWDSHTDEERGRFVDELKNNGLPTLIKLFDERVLRKGREFEPTGNALRVYKTDNPLGIEVEANDWGTQARAVGTRKELIDSKLCADYMFDQLGERNKRSGPTEYGDRFKLEKRADGRYHITLWVYPKAKKPYGMGHIDMYETDISALLKQISGCAS